MLPFTTSPADETTRFRVAGSLVTRVCGLDVSVLDRLRCPKTYAAMHTCLDHEAELAAEGTALSDELYPLIGSLTATRLRPRLIGLRRALHRGRAPGRGERPDELADVLPAPLRDRITAWLAARDRQAERLAALPDLLAAESDDARAELRDIVSAPTFRRALCQASPTLYDVLTRWLTEPGYRPRRRSVTRLAKYVVRAATKTSPYSTFTISGLGRWASESGSAPESGWHTRMLDPGTPHCLPELEGVVLDRLRRAVRATPESRTSLPVRPNPSLTTWDGTLNFVCPGSSESIVTVPDDSLVGAVIADVRAHPRTLPELTDHLAETHRAERAQVARYLDKLLDIGLLEITLPVPDQATDQFTGLITGRPGDAGKLETVRDELDTTLAVSDVEGHRRRVDTVATAVGQLADRIDPGGEHSRVIAERLPRKMFLYDNAVFAGPVAECSPREWRPALADLDLLRRWSAVYDPALPLRLLLAELLVRRFGPGARVPFLVLHRAVRQEIESGGWLGVELRAAMDEAYFGYSDDDGESELPRLRQLRGLRAETEATLLAGDVAHTGSVTVSRSAVDALAASWPEWVESPSAVTAYVQQVPTGAEPALAVNAMLTGYGRGRVRVHRMVALADGPDTPPSVPWPRAPERFAEFGGGWGSTLNLRVPTAEFEIDYPGCVPDRPPGSRIPIGDLNVELDTATGLAMLVSPEVGPVRPLHLGGMADALLPPAARLLSHAFGGGGLTNPAVASIDHRGAPRIPDGVRGRARVSLGNLILRRASWLVPVDHVPTRDPGEGPAPYTYRLLRWCRAHGIPETGFVHAVDGSGEPDTGRRAFRTSRKPVYLDLADPFLVEVFEQMVAAPETGAMLFVEALPDPADAPLGLDGNRHVTEFAVEIAGAHR